MPLLAASFFLVLPHDGTDRQRVSEVLLCNTCSKEIRCHSFHIMIQQFLRIFFNDHIETRIIKHRRSYPGVVYFPSSKNEYGI